MKMMKIILKKIFFHFNLNNIYISYLNRLFKLNERKSKKNKKILYLIILLKK